MKKILLFLLLIANISLQAQKKLFTVYTDSAKLISAADEIASSFFSKLRQADPSIIQAPSAVLNTQSSLVFYVAENNTINLPLWSQVSPSLKTIFYELAGGNEKEGKAIFGLFYNGFYIVQRLGNAVQFTKERSITNKYQGEYFANALAILFLKESVYKSQLEKCSSYVNGILKILPDPVPAGEYTEDYYQKNYEKIVEDPKQYLYFQFSQFKKAYDNKSLTTFDNYLKNYLIR